MNKKNKVMGRNRQETAD